MSNIIESKPARLVNRDAVAISFAVLDLTHDLSKHLDLDGKIAAHRISKLCRDIIKYQRSKSRQNRTSLSECK